MLVPVYIKHCHIVLKLADIFLTIIKNRSSTSRTRETEVFIQINWVSNKFEIFSATNLFDIQQLCVRKNRCLASSCHSSWEAAL